MVTLLESDLCHAEDTSDVYDLGTVFLDIIDADILGTITAAEKSIDVHRSMLVKSVMIRVVDTKVRYLRNTNHR